MRNFKIYFFIDLFYEVIYLLLDDRLKKPLFALKKCVNASKRAATNCDDIAKACLFAAIF